MSRFQRPLTLLFLSFVFLSLLLYHYNTNELVRVHIRQINIQWDRRLLWWDGTNTPEEEYCASTLDGTYKEPIPNVVNFVLLANEPDRANISFATFLAIKAALVNLKPEEVRLHVYENAFEEDNTYWNALKPHVSLVPHARSSIPIPPSLSDPAQAQLPHQSDFLRLEILSTHGGIYLDTDVYALKPFDHLRSSPRDVLMGHEGGNRAGLCNAVVLSRPNSTFLARWRETYASFKRTEWNLHSVLMPKRLQVQHPSEICALGPRVFFWPTYVPQHVAYMYEELDEDEQVDAFREELEMNGGAMYEEQLAFHAWGGREFLKDLTSERVRHVDTRFNLLVRGINDASL